MKFLTFVPVALASLAVANAMSVNTQNRPGAGLNGVQLKSEINKVTEEIKGISAPDRRADVADGGIPSLQSLVVKMSQLSNEFQAIASGDRAKEHGLGRRDGGLLGNILNPLLGNVEDAVSALLGDPSLKPVGDILTDFLVFLKGLPTVTVGNSQGH
ncbi:hypothetical protein K438DRAFT_1811932 [Mycena galopus ATCC 62051]|nr:hypothetical protein K438DRAFT_1811932 [Mycena galopus ATCC 62051]